MNIIHKTRETVTKEEIDAINQLHLPSGLMALWYFNSTKPIDLMFLYHRKRIVGWSCFIWEDWSKCVDGKIAVYVKKSVRKRGYGKTLLTSLLYEIHNGLKRKCIRIEERISHWVKPYEITLAYF